MQKSARFPLASASPPTVHFISSSLLPSTLHQLLMMLVIVVQTLDHLEYPYDEKNIQPSVSQKRVYFAFSLALHTEQNINDSMKF